MKSAYCPHLERLVSAHEYNTIGFSNLRFICPECRREVRFRNWRNSPPYFAHVRYNPSCSLSVEGDGELFVTIDRGDPINSKDMLNLAEGINTKILFDAGVAMLKGKDIKVRTAGASCLVYATEFGSLKAKEVLRERYGNDFGNLNPYTMDEILNIARTKTECIRGREKRDAVKRFVEKMDYEIRLFYPDEQNDSLVRRFYNPAFSLISLITDLMPFHTVGSPKISAMDPRSVKGDSVRTLMSVTAPFLTTYSTI